MPMNGIVICTNPVHGGIRICRSIGLLVIAYTNGYMGLWDHGSHDRVPLVSV